MPKLTLKDIKLFNKYLNFSRPELAAFSFANIYIWRALYEIEWELIAGSLCVFFKDKIGCFMYLPPLGKERRPQSLKLAFQLMDKENKNPDISRIENVPQEDLDYFRTLGYLAHEKYPDYLCLTKELSGLKGNKFKSQRSAYNYFTRHYVSQWRSLQKKDIAGVLNLFDCWAHQRKALSTDELYCGMIDDSQKVIKAALKDFVKLKLEGIIVKIDQQLKAFTFGYRLNQDTFCVLYEVTDLSIKGLAQFIFRTFASQLKKYRYFNIMDDSGLENLRKTKLAYKPARLVPAYIITRDA